jgi:hypothetical protein
MYLACMPHRTAPQKPIGELSNKWSAARVYAGTIARSADAPRAAMIDRRRAPPIMSLPKRIARADMTTRTVSLVFALGLIACATCCTAIDAYSSGNPQPAMLKQPGRYASAACFYSDVSGTDRVIGGRVLHWCGPEPRAVF